MSDRTAIDKSVASRLVDAAFLRTENGGAFSEESPPPEWYHEIFGREGKPGVKSPFLADFLDRVGESGEVILKSGLWEERGRFFEATATKEEDATFLMIEAADERHDFQQQILHSNHLHELRRQRLQKELELKKVLLECVMHDLANPSAVLLMNLQHIERHLPDAEEAKLRPAVDRAIGQVNRQKQLIQSIADVFGADANHAEEMSVEEAPDLSKIAEDMVAEQKARAESLGIGLEFEAPPSALVRADPLYLRRIFENILTNAIRHSPEGGVVRVAVKKKGRFVNGEITDEGPGFGIDCEKAFAPFAQGTENAGGSGLGLYFCRMATEMFGGNIRAENRKNGGAKMIFNLPSVS